MSGVHDYYLVQGETSTFRIRWLEDDTPVDVSASTANFAVRKTFREDDVLLARSSENNEITLDDDGNIVVLFPADVSAALTVPSGSGAPKPKLHNQAVFYLLGRYNLEVTSEDGETTKRLLEGDFYLNPEIVR